MVGKRITISCQVGDSHISLQGHPNIALGTPLTDIKTRTSIDARRHLSLLEGAPKWQQTSTISALPTPKPPASITFVRNRMFYARAALNPKGKVTFGLRHIRKFQRTCLLLIGDDFS